LGAPEKIGSKNSKIGAQFCALEQTINYNPFQVGQKTWVELWSTNNKV